MKRLLLIGCLLCRCGSFAQDYLFYLHNRYLEEFSLTDEHPEYGRAEYNEIIAAFEHNGFKVFSEKRAKDTDIQLYAKKIVRQIDSLLKTGVAPDHITVLGTSKGGYIAQYVSTYLKNPEVNYVLVGCFMNDDIKELPDIQLCGNILSIYATDDAYGVPMLKRVETSNLKVTRFREIELSTGMRHGFLYKPLPDWVFPATQWGKRNYRWEQLSAAFTDLMRQSSFYGTALVAKNNTIVFVPQAAADTMLYDGPVRENLYWIGSVSKQFTAVIVLQEVERGRIDLHTPIGNYLPDLKESWTGQVTVHHLLTHTHGIPEPSLRDPNASLLFAPGTAYEYSQYGYALLAQIVENTSGKSFADLSDELFSRCGMYRTFHPDRQKHRPVLAGYRNGRQVADVPAVYPAAGGFASQENDLLTWNNQLHGGKLLPDSLYRLMIAPQPNAVRQHPLFGETLYGYGITTLLQNGALRLGQTGLVPGFCSMNFYYPGTGVSLIILSNEERNTQTKGSFAVHMQLLEILENSGLTQNLRYKITVDRQ